MIGLPSGLVRVRWNEFGQFAAALDDAEDRRAARTRRLVAFEHERARALRHDEAVAVLREGLGRRFRRIIGGRQRRQKREPDEVFRVHGPVGGDAQRRLGFAAADRFDAELDRARARGAGGGERDGHALRAELVGEVRPHRAEHEAVVIALESSRRGGPQQVIVMHLVVCARGGGKVGPLRPFDFDRRDREEQRTREAPAAADIRLRDRFFAGEFAEPLGQRRRAERLDRHEIDRAGDPRLHGFGREALDRADAGLPADKPGPVLLRSGAERGDDAHAGDRHHGAAGLVAQRRHMVLLSGPRWSFSRSGIPYPAIPAKAGSEFCSAILGPRLRGASGKPSSGPPRRRRGPRPGNGRPR